jgi:hypothetical protein
MGRTMSDANSSMSTLTSREIICKANVTPTAARTSCHS